MHIIDLNMSPIPLPEVFQHTHAWTYGCPHASPSLGSDSIVPPELSDPDIVYVRPPDKIHVFKTPGTMQYIPVPEMPPEPTDPTGMRRMMEFLGFDKQHVDAAVAGVSSQMTPSTSSTATTPGSTARPAQSAPATGSTIPVQPTAYVATGGQNPLPPGLIRSL